MIKQSNSAADAAADNLIGSDAFTVDNKKIGKVIALDKKKNNKNHLIVLKKGIVHDEEFHIPIDSITEILDRESKIIINLNEEEIKHGYEFLNKDSPSSDLISGKSDSTLSTPFEKEKIKYQSFSYDLENPNNNKNTQVKVDEFLCDMCQAQFKDPSELELHRKNKHSGPVGI
jgi:hypothetical protein